MDFNQPDATGQDRAGPPLARRLEEAEARGHRLALRRAALLERSRHLHEETGRAKGRLALRPRVEAALERLQERAHERSVGVYERLLTGLVGDVLPGERRIALSLGTERGLPALDIEVDRNGHREGIIDGSGGSLTNIVSTGLRFAALVRSGRRRFIALDEPDCWLAPDRVPAFSNVIATIAREVGVQTLLVSHHDPELFAADSQIVRLEPSPHGLHALGAGPPPEWPAPDTPGIRHIRLVDFMSHRDTRVPLAPGVTTLVGANNLGKSAILAALRACAYGASAESVIRHGAPAARVELGIEHGRTILWERRRRGAGKVTWRRLGPDGETEIETALGRGVPDWVVADLGIAPLDDIDIQLGHQKRPIFLLDQPPRQRAQILSIGRESGHLQTMLARYKEMVRTDTETVRRGEAELAALQAPLDALQELETPTAELRDLRRALAALAEDESRAAAMEAAIARLTAAQARLDATAARLSALSDLPAPPALDRAEPLAALIESLETRQTATARAEAVADRLATLPEDAPGLPVPPDGMAALADKLADLDRLDAAVTAGQEQAAAIAADLARTEAELRGLLDRLDHHCPLCGQPIADADHLLGRHHD